MIVIVEDDASIRELVCYTFNNTGSEAIGFSNATKLFAYLDETIPDIILLDIMLPGMDGISILKKIRSDIKTKNIPCIMLTAKDTEYDKVIGLDNGADDYITKPFGMMELVSRVKAVLRRAGTNGNKQSTLEYKKLIVDDSAHTVTVDGKKVILTLKEYQLLYKLLLNKNVVLTRDELLNSIWGYDFDGETRTVDVHIRTLRSKLMSAGDYIQTVRGVGYRIGES